MPTTRTSLGRWALLLAVIAGVFGMHVLTAGDGPGHGALPTVMASDHHGTAATTALDPAPSGPSMTSSPPTTGHGDMTGCVLFLVVGGVLLLVVALGRLGSGRRHGYGRANGGLPDLRRRGPPDGWPRLALNVIRV